MFAIFKQFKNSAQTEKQKKILAQMERELVLFQASDWAFMIHNHSADGYAEKRLAEHERDFMKLDAMFRGEFEDDKLLQEIMFRDNIFPWIQ